MSGEPFTIKGVSGPTIELESPIDSAASRGQDTLTVKKVVKIFPHLVCCDPLILEAIEARRQSCIWIDFQALETLNPTLYTLNQVKLLKATNYTYVQNVEGILPRICKNLLTARKKVGLGAR